MGDLERARIVAFRRANPNSMCGHSRLRCDRCVLTRLDWLDFLATNPTPEKIDRYLAAATRTGQEYEKIAWSREGC